MYIKKRYGILPTVKWSRSGLIMGSLSGTAAVILYDLAGLHWVAIPWQPVSLIGIALAFYLGFKNNSSYDRTWEARKIWGGIVNDSRSFGAMVVNYISNLHATTPAPDEEIRVIKRKFIFNHLAWLTALRFQLRMPRPWEHINENLNRNFKNLQIPEFKSEMKKELSEFLDAEEISQLEGKTNVAAQLLFLQSRILNTIRQKGLIDDFRHMEMQNMITRMFEGQGKSERIKNFPFPRQYASATHHLVIMFSILLPFTLLEEFTVLGSYFIWLTVPFNALASWVFLLMELIGDYSENPFEGTYNDIPITSISRAIEIDLKELLEEKDIPAPVTPVDDFLL